METKKSVKIIQIIGFIIPILSVIVGFFLVNTHIPKTIEYVLNSSQSDTLVKYMTITLIESICCTIIGIFLISFNLLKNKYSKKLCIIGYIVILICGIIIGVILGYGIYNLIELENHILTPSQDNFQAINSILSVV
ncbi:MAG: hypothetical protein VZS44_09215 [Bacilli bacterium]|nr:hypothetical protein [Bacilli bacterium]